MKYAAIIEYIQDKEKINQVRPVHRQYLASLKEKGQLAASGPFTDDWAALIVYEASTPQEAEALLKADPFCGGGIFVRWTLRPWNAVIANRELFPA